MLYIHFILFSILAWIYDIESLEVIPERAQKVYINPKYLYLNATVNVRRYSRKSLYYVNAQATTKQMWDNNVTVTLGVSQFLHNEYRKSFVELSYRLCDLVINDPFFGGALKNSGLVCPCPPGFHSLPNITAPTEHFPSVFPFEKGRLDIALSVTATKEQMLQLNVEASFKQKPRRK